METDPERATNVKAIVSLDDTTSSKNVDEDDEARSTKRRRVTSAPTAVRSVKQIVVEDLRSDDEGTLVRALCDLWLVHLDYERDDIQEMQGEFFNHGGHLAVSWIMEKHPDCRRIQRYGIGAVLRASYRNIKNKEFLGKTRAIHVVYAAMQRFPQDTSIIRNGFKAINNLTYQCESNSEILVEELDALPFLVKQMSSKVNDVKSIKLACAMLRNISKFPQFRPRVIRAKAVSALGRAVENHEIDDQIQAVSKQALTLLFRRTK
jgi:hypothetical protein